MKITITIEDDGDAVKVVSDPSFGALMQSMSERQPTAAETYAQSMLNKAREMSKLAAETGSNVRSMPIPKRIKGDRSVQDPLAPMDTTFPKPDSIIQENDTEIGNKD